MLQTISIIVTGKVQGVYYRQSTRQKAAETGITGTVSNLQDGSVYIIATGTKDQLDKLCQWCRQGPAKAAVTGIETKDEPLREFKDFRIIR
jgi:acylphosphatase